MIASYDAIEPEKSDFVSAGFNTDNYVKVGICDYLPSSSFPFIYLFLNFNVRF